MSKPLISVIIPAYNEEKYIERTLRSISNSDYKNYEIIVVCDACSDSTFRCAKKHTSNIYSVDANNVSIARNKGVEKAKGDILVFCDADTIFPNNYLEHIINAVNNGVDYGTGKFISESKTVIGNFITGCINRFNINNKTVSGNFFVKKHLFEEVGGFDINLIKGEDSEIGERLSHINAKYAFIRKLHFIPSERKFRRHGFLRHSITLTKEAWLYNLSRERYKTKFSKSLNINK